MLHCARGSSCAAKITPWLLLYLLATLTLPVKASADDAYGQGISAFKRGAYEEAITYFLQSLGGGTDDPNVHYNLGASYYRLGDFQQAREHFLKVTESAELASLGYYNLGLVAARTDQPEAAENWFRRVLESSDNPKLQALAQAMLEHIALEWPPLDEPAVSQLSLGAEPAAPWSGFVVGDFGYDSNVILASDNQTLTTSELGDTFIDVFGSVSRSLIEDNGGVSLDLEGSAYVLKYDDIAGYDIDSLRIGAVVGHDISAWQAEESGHLSYTFLDGRQFTRESILAFKSSRWLTPDHTRLRLRYELSRIDAMNAQYTYLDGWRNRADGRLSWLFGERLLHLMYQFETNDRADLHTPGFTSYSPVRNSLRLIAETPVVDALRATGELQYYSSHYRDPNQLADGSFSTRRDNRTSVIGRLAYRLASQGELSLEYRRTANRSNLNSYDYTQHQIMLGLMWSF